MESLKIGENSSNFAKVYHTHAELSLKKPGKYTIVRDTPSYDNIPRFRVSKKVSESFYTFMTILNDYGLTNLDKYSTEKTRSFTIFNGVRHYLDRTVKAAGKYAVSLGAKYQEVMKFEKAVQQLSETTQFPDCSIYNKKKFKKIQDLILQRIEYAAVTQAIPSTEPLVV